MTAPARMWADLLRQHIADLEHALLFGPDDELQNVVDRLDALAHDMDPQP